MYSRAIDLKEFYESILGRVVQRIIRHHIRHLWPDVQGQRLLGLGYAVPYLKPFMGEAERVLSLMPMHQGAVFWPQDEKGLVGICDEECWPVETSSVDRILVIHTGQGYESLDSILRESWRVLTGQGRLILIVPNRTGLWARLDNTPFGHGAPYSAGQLRQILKDYMFVPEKIEHALYVPPSSSRLMLVTAGAWEKLGQKFFSAFGGINIAEASKQLYAGTLAGAPATAEIRRRVLVTKPISTTERS